MQDDNNKTFEDFYQVLRVDHEEACKEFSLDDLKQELVEAQLKLMASKADTHVILKLRVRANVLLQAVIKQDRRGMSHRWFLPLDFLTNYNKKVIKSARDRVVVKRFGTKEENVNV